MAGQHSWAATFTWDGLNKITLDWTRLDKTQFQIEGGGVVQGVTKLISTFSASVS